MYQHTEGPTLTFGGVRHKIEAASKLQNRFLLKKNIQVCNSLEPDFVIDEVWQAT